MFIKQSPSLLSSPASSLLPPKGAPTSTGSIHASNKIFQAERSFISSRRSIQPPETWSLSLITSIPKKPIHHPQSLQKYRLHASASDPAHAHELDAGGLDHGEPSATFSQMLDVVYRFVRPYSVVGTAMTVASASFLPVTSLADLTPTFFMGLTKALIVGSLMNLYVIAVNQIFDVEIDKVNKPYLPLVTGEISMTAATILTASFVIMSLVVALMSQSTALLTFVGLAFFLGSAYSVNLPLLRWKNSPLLTTVTLVSWRGTLMPVAFFLHMQVYVLKRQMVLTKPAIFLTAFMAVFIAFFGPIKDIPDIEGDRSNGVKTLPVLFGPEKVFWVCIKLLTVVYVACMGVGATSAHTVGRTVMIVGHGLLASFLWSLAKSVDFEKKDSLTRFYMGMWKLLIAECVIVQFLR